MDPFVSVNNSYIVLQELTSIHVGLPVGGRSVQWFHGSNKKCHLVVVSKNPWINGPKMAQVSQRIWVTCSTLYCWFTSPYVLTSPCGIP